MSNLVLRSLSAAAAAAVCVIGLAGPVGAQGFVAQSAGQVVIEVDGVVTDFGEGEVVQVASEPVPADLQGLECTGQGSTQNNSSVHPGNDLVVRSGGTQGVLSDVEAEPGKVTQMSGSVTLGDTVIVDLVVGPDEFFSGDIDIVLECAAPATTTSTTAVPDSTTPDSTTPDSTTPPATGDSGDGDSTATTAPSSPGGQLPSTGPDRTATGLLTGAGFIAVGAGALLVARIRPARPSR